MKHNKEVLITLLYLTKDLICLYENSPYITAGLFRVYMSNKRYNKECDYLVDKIKDRLGDSLTPDEWLYKQLGFKPKPTLMRQWRGQWIDMLVAEIEEHGRLK